MLLSHVKGFCLSMFEKRTHTQTHTHLSGGQHVVQVLQERFVFDVVVSEQKGDPATLLASQSVQSLQVFQEVATVVSPGGREEKVLHGVLCACPCVCVHVCVCVCVCE